MKATGRGRNRRNRRNRTQHNVPRREQGFLAPETKSFAYGVGVGVLAMLLFPQLKDNLKPAAAGVVKGVTDISEKVQDIISQLREDFEDIVAEAKFENFKAALDKEIMDDAGAPNTNLE